MFILVTYDIPDNKRRQKVAKLLLDYGGQRVQRSVFECYITARNLEQLQVRVKRVHNEEEDSIRFYFLCDNCLPKMVLIGIAQPIDEPGLRII